MLTTAQSKSAKIQDSLLRFCFSSLFCQKTLAYVFVPSYEWALYNIGFEIQIWWPEEIVRRNGFAWDNLLMSIWQVRLAIQCLVGYLTEVDPQPDNYCACLNMVV